jgi:hypothetical protein
MTVTERPHVVLIHWHDVCTHLGAYGHGDVAKSCRRSAERLVCVLRGPGLAGPGTCR